ncbi:MAG: hypothetical protein FJX74_11415 [Armatimonadetes bacterium]|nr:hypothetical protein [Armatimonadota bacterium]
MSAKADPTALMTDPPGVAPATGAITPRAVALAFVLVIAFTAAGCFSVFLRYEIIGTGYLPRGAVALLLALIAGNALLRRLPRLNITPLTARELLFIFLVLMVVGAIAGQEYAQHFYLNLVGLVYYATPDVVAPNVYLDNLNPMLVPSKDPAGSAAVWAHEGLPPGGAMPWGAWVRPLLVWTPFLLAVYWMVLTFAALLAWRWEREEKLPYPLMSVPLEVTEDEPAAAAPLLRGWPTWIAFSLPCVHYTLQGLHGYWPAVPFINLDPDPKWRFTGPMAAFNGVLLWLRMDMVGVTYLLAAEVGFSLWFFFLFRRVQQFVRLSVGVNTGEYQFFRLQTTGGYVLLGGALLYSARGHLRRVLSAAIGSVRRGPTDPDAREPYRLAVFGFLAAFAFAVAWCVYFGMRPIWAMTQYVFFPLVGMVVARVICEAGMNVYSAPIGGYVAGFNEALFTLIGPRRLGPRNLTLMTMTSWCQIRSTATQNAAAVFQGYRLGSDAGFPRGRVMVLALAAIAISILTCHLVAPWIIYTWSVPKLAPWPTQAGLNTARGLGNLINQPLPMTPTDWLAIGMGAATTWALFALRRRFVWWPLHPLGFVTWLSWPIERYWSSIFVGWVIKTVIVRLGGYGTFRKLRPVAFGLILGMNVIFVVWLIIHMIWPGPPGILID